MGFVIKFKVNWLKGKEDLVKLMYRLWIVVGVGFIYCYIFVFDD